MVTSVGAEETYDLRHRVLGRGATAADVAAADDDDPDSGHFVIKVDGAVVATGTVRRRGSPRAGDGSHWQVRGMAVEPPFRGRGLGSSVLRAILDMSSSEVATLCGATPASLRAPSTNAMASLPRENWPTTPSRAFRCT